LVATCLVPWSVIQQRVYETRVHDIYELRQHLLHVWRGLEQSLIEMTQLTNGKRACVLVFVSVVDILNILCDYQFIFSVLDEVYVAHHA